MPSHGSLTKAGKVRDRTPQLPITNTRKKPIPRVSNYRSYSTFKWKQDMERKRHG